MPKDSSFRVCIALLLVIQAICWAFTLVDLWNPGKPRLLLRTSMEVVARAVAKRGDVLLLYREFRVAF
jgi:DMSO reductase anchor subunit